MYVIAKELTFSGGHCLSLDYDSPCKRFHGHNWKVKLWFKSKLLDENGMVIDFATVKKWVMNTFDHRDITDLAILEGKNPTAEHIAKVICDAFGKCFKVEIWETYNSYACYVEDEF